MQRKWLYPGLATGVVLGVAILASGMLSPAQTRAQATPSEGAAAPTVEVISPERRDLVRQTRLPGTIMPWEEISLYAKVSGYLREIRVDKGDRVKRGQLLAVLDVPEMVDELAQQQAQERAAQARSREPIVSMATARAELLHSQSELDQVRAELEAARAAALEPESQMAAARAEVAAARAAVQEPMQDVETAQANLRAAQADLEVAEADLDRYQADYELRERIYQRYKRLVEREVITQQEFDQAEAAYNAARAAMSTAKSRISATRERVGAAESAVRSAQAKVATAEARAATPEAQMQNIEARGRTARTRVVAAEKAVGIAEARVQVARARLQETSTKIISAASDVATAAAGARKTRTLMQYSQLTAPCAGVITARNVDSGQLIQASTASQARPLLVVSNVDRLRITLPLPESDVPHLKVGNPVSLTVRELPGRTWKGRITRYTNDLDPVARTMSAEIDLANPDRALLPGMYADVVVDLETHRNALVVPTSAVVVEKQKRSLWVDRDGKAQKVEVAVGVDNGVDAEIPTGIGDSDRIIVSGQTGLQSGQAVKSIPARKWSGSARLRREREARSTKRDIGMTASHSAHRRGFVLRAPCFVLRGGTTSMVTQVGRRHAGPSAGRWTAVLLVCAACLTVEVGLATAGTLPSLRSGGYPAPAAAPVAAPVSVPIETGALQNIATERRPIDLPTALRLAREQNLSIAQVDEFVDEQAAFRRGARAQALPNIGFSAGLARLIPNIATVAGVPAGRATLFVAPGRVYFDARAARFAVRSAEFRREDVTQQVLLQAATRYYNLQLTEGLVRVAELSLAQAQELVRQTQELQQGGRALPADVSRARAQLAQEQQGLVEAQKDFKVASISLATLLRIPPTVTLVASERQVAETTLVSMDEPMDRLVERAFRRRPELGQVNADIEGAKARRQSALWGGVIPLIGVERWFGGVTTDTPQPSRRTWFYAEWRLLDNLGESVRSKMDQARSQEREARLRREELREQIIGEVLAAQQSVLATREQIAVAQQEVAAAEASLQVFRERFVNGLGLQLDVLAGQEAVTRARQNLVRAVVRYNVAQAELLTSLGERISNREQALGARRQ